MLTSCSPVASFPRKLMCPHPSHARLGGRVAGGLMSQASAGLRMFNVSHLDQYRVVPVLDPLKADCRAAPESCQVPAFGWHKPPAQPFGLTLGGTSTHRLDCAMSLNRRK